MLISMEFFQKAHLIPRAGCFAILKPRNGPNRCCLFYIYALKVVALFDGGGFFVFEYPNEQRVDAVGGFVFPRCYLPTM